MNGSDRIAEAGALTSVIVTAAVSFLDHIIQINEMLQFIAYVVAIVSGVSAIRHYQRLKKLQK